MCVYNFDFNVLSENSDANITLDKCIKGDIFYLTVCLNQKAAVSPEAFSVKWIISGVGCNSLWRPFERNHTLKPDWGKNVGQSRLASGLPIYQVVSAEDKNTICFSVSDADTPIKLKSGYIEETAEIECEIEFFHIPTNPIKEYKAIVRIDMRNVPFYESIYSTVSWWENDCGYISAPVPDNARLPVDSLWYSFHQKLDHNKILEECKRSYELGMRTVIIDDGWQTGDNNRGYAYCGDWEIFEPKMGDMPSLVNKLHKIGMKVVLWYSVPFIGINSKRFDEFKDMLLDESGNEIDFFALDPRYKKVREYLCSIYEKAAIDWCLDGFKLDFIDSFVLKGKSLECDPRRDFQSLEDAIHALLSEVVTRLRSINPEIMIEFRQSYIGPSIRKYGNMLRVGDCPADYLSNRSQIIDLRLTSGNTAVHSDMVMWNDNEKVEIAALQLANIIFAVPQISVDLSSVSSKHKQAIKYYIDFYNKHKDVLSFGYLTAKKPETGYSQATITKDNKSVVAVYTDSVVNVNTDYCVIVNASDFNSIIVKNCKNKKFKQVSCCGDVLSDGLIDNDIFEIPVTIAGLVFVNN